MSAGETRLAASPDGKASWPKFIRAHNQLDSRSLSGLRLFLWFGEVSRERGKRTVLHSI